VLVHNRTVIFPGVLLYKTAITPMIAARAPMAAGVAAAAMLPVAEVVLLDEEDEEVEEVEEVELEVEVMVELENVVTVLLVLDGATVVVDDGEAEVVVAPAPVVVAAVAEKAAQRAEPTD
jgi:hypothetical protein